MQETARPLPDVTDPEFAFYWNSTKEERLVVQKCTNCGLFRWPPREICLACRSFEWEWSPADPVGELYSWTVVERASLTGIPTPYVVAVVELRNPAGIRVLGNLVDVKDPSAELTIGCAVEAVFERVTPDVVLPQWRVLSSPLSWANLDPGEA
jgi:uncharacterized OB-fold protein